MCVSLISSFICLLHTRHSINVSTFSEEKAINLISNQSAIGLIVLTEATTDGALLIIPFLDPPPVPTQLTARGH